MLLSHCQVADKIKTVQIFGHNSSKWKFDSGENWVIEFR
jgi:hypothetical protein